MTYFEQLREYYHSQPSEVSIETQALCNARCTFCPYPTLERKGTKMPDELLHRLVDEMAAFETSFFFSPFKVNEPFLDKRLLPLCERFNRDVPLGRLRLFTNGSALTDKHIEGVAGLKNVEHLWISLNEHDPVRYETTMGLNFEHTAKNLDRLHEYVVGWKFRHKVVVSRVGMDQEFVEYVVRRWPHFKPALIKRDAWIDFTNSDSDEVPDGPCGRWWELNIMANGKVSHCCMDSGETDRFVIGDLNSQTMLEVYNSSAWKKHRDTASRRTLGDESPCQRCTY